MTVTQVLRKTGSWSIKLVQGAPDGLTAGLDYFGHVAVIPGLVNPVERGDECLTLARHVGILRDLDTQDQATLGGPGLAAWLGDENGKGDVIESPGVTVTAGTFVEAVRALLPAHGAITEGTLHTGVTGTITNTWTYQTPKVAIDYVCDTLGGTWRVNGDGTLDAGPASSLFRTTPSCVIARKDVAGYDMGLHALAGTIQTARSVKDYITRAVCVAQALAGGTADAATVPYKDIHGNPVQITKVVDETSETTYANAEARAQGILDTYAGPALSTRLAVSDFDVAGDFEPGDTVWAWDPQGGLIDQGNELQFRGRLIYPAAVQVLSVTWPITSGYTVAYRDGDGSWTDLTPWVDWETISGGQVEVADIASTALTSSVGTSGTQVAGGGGGLGDIAVPDTPTFGTFSTSSYQPDDGLARAAVTLTWTEPTNTDGSTIVDGDAYEIRYRPTGTTDWDMVAVPFDQLQTTVTNLPPACGYDWQIRAADYATPRNVSGWSATTEYATAEDVTAPGAPAPPAVAESLIAVQVTHTLGLASGGTYNLPLDMDHFEVHVGTVSSFVPDTGSMVGKLSATGGMVTSGTPAVGTFPIDTLVDAGETAYVKVIAVDRTGNRSAASSSASKTALLIDDAHISDLTVSKVTAGELSASVLLSGDIKTSESFPRVALNANGLLAYNASGTETVNISGVDGSVSIVGKIRTGLSGQRIVVDPGGTEDITYPYSAIHFYPATGDITTAGHIGLQGGSTVLGLLSGKQTVSSVDVRSHLDLVGAYCLLEQRKLDGTQWGGRVFVDTEFVSLTSNRGITSVSGTSGAHVQVTTSGGGNVEITAGSSGDVELNADNGDIVIVANGGKIDLVGDDVYCNPALFNSVSSGYVEVGVEVGAEQGKFCAISSSRRFKTGIEEWTPEDPTSLLRLTPVTYYDKKKYEASKNGDGCVRTVGLIAEDVLDVPEIGDLAVFTGPDGLTMGVHYSRAWVMLLPLLKQMYADIQEMKKA